MADMVYLLAEVSAAHTRPLQLPPLGHVDTKDSCTLHDVEKLVLDQSLTAKPAKFKECPNVF
ncbi:hypothetical protein CJU76_02555 [Pseudomonas fragi]|nr:hypothetical protein [Pseudomonas sp. TMW22080]PAA05450.1 hypothetical protein CJU76_02555 [Pseudomonas fragi]